MADIKPEIKEFLEQWLQDDSSVDVVEWFIDIGVISRPALRQLLMGVYDDHKDDPDMTEYAQKAKRAAQLL